MAESNRGPSGSTGSAHSAGPVAATLALVLLLVLGACASAANAAPLALTFIEARANVGVQLSDAALFATPATAPFAAQIGPAGESITGGALQVPQFATHITTPIDADVTVDFDIGTIAGTFDPASGALALSGEAGGTLKANGKECTVSTTPSPLVLSTAGSSGGTNPRSGAPFVHGLTGTGAIAGQWTDMQATPVDPNPGGDTFFCEDVEDQIKGPGGIWLQQEGDVTPPAAPQLMSTDPASPSPSGTPRIRGTAEVGSTVSVYAGPGCAGAPVASGTAAELGSPGLGVQVTEDTTAVFSATATDPAANTSTCSAPISYTHAKATIGSGGGDEGQGGGSGGLPLTPTPACTVPKLAGKTLARAKVALAAAGCSLGTVHKPKRPRGKGRARLVVRSTTPEAGARLAGGQVDVRLGPKPRKAT